MVYNPDRNPNPDPAAPNVTTHVFHGNKQPSSVYVEFNAMDNSYKQYCENPDHPDGMQNCDDFSKAVNTLRLTRTTLSLT